MRLMNKKIRAKYGKKLQEGAKKLGERIAKLREDMENKLSQNQLAFETGITPEHLCRIEHGEHYPGYDVLLMIAWRLKVKISYLTRGTDLDIKDW